LLRRGDGLSPPSPPASGGMRAAARVAAAAFLLTLQLDAANDRYYGAGSGVDADGAVIDRDSPEWNHGRCNGQLEGTVVGGRRCAGKLLKKCPAGKKCEGQRRKKAVRETTIVEESLVDAYSGKRIMRETVVTEYEVKDLPRDRERRNQPSQPQGVTYYKGTAYPVVDGFTLVATVGGGLEYVPDAPVAPAGYGIPQPAGMYGTPHYLAQHDVYDNPQWVVAQPPPVQYMPQPPPAQYMPEPTLYYAAEPVSSPLVQPLGLDYMQPPPAYRVIGRRPYDEPESPNYGFGQL